MKFNALLLTGLLFTSNAMADSFASVFSKANQGDIAAQYQVGMMYLEGDRVDQDTKKAITWLRQAGSEGDSQAQHQLGMMYYDGLHVDENQKEGIDWFRKAGLQGHVEAQYRLGLAYGKGQYKDHRASLMWYREAAEQGYPAAVECVRSGFKTCL